MSFDLQPAQDERALATLVSQLRATHPEQADDVLALFVLQLKQKPPAGSPRARLVTQLEQRACRGSVEAPSKALGTYLRKNSISKTLLERFTLGLREWTTAVRCARSPAASATAQRALGSAASGAHVQSRVTDPDVLFSGS